MKLPKAHRPTCA